MKRVKRKSGWTTRTSVFKFSSTNEFGPEQSNCSERRKEFQRSRYAAAQQKSVKIECVKTACVIWNVQNSTFTVEYFKGIIEINKRAGY